MLRAIIFDLGGVILIHKANLIPDILSQLFSVSEEQGIQIWKEKRVALLSGAVSSYDFLKSLRKDYPTKYTLKELSEHWDALYRKNAKIDGEMLALIERLRRSYEVYLLTDTIDIHDAYNLKRGIYEKFTKAFKSHIEKLTKAQGEKIFKHILKKIQKTPKECLFIDDLAEYVKCAQGLGMEGIVFTSPSKLKHDLHKQGVLF